MRTVLRIAALALAACSSLAQAQSEIILDNGTAAFTTTGTWPTSTATAGFIGPNYQTHEANGPLPGALVVDNGGPGFSATGTWPTSTAVAGYLGTNYQVHTPNGEPPTAIVADNTSGTAVGTWPLSTAVSGFYGTNYQPHPAGTGTETFTWTLNVASAGTYEVYARWTAHPNRASNAKYTVSHSGGQDLVTMNQQANSGTWQLLGTYSFDAGAATITLSDDASGYVIADAVMLAPPGAAPNTATWSFNVPAPAQYNVYARWTAHPNRASNAPYTVNHAAGSTTVIVNQEQAGGVWFLLGTFNFNAGASTVTLTDQANDYVIADSVMLAPPGAAPNTATWIPNVAQAGTYQVYARWTASTNRATNATYTVTDAAGSTPITVSQQANGGVWNPLGTFSLQPGSAHKVTLTDQANGYVIADAIRLVVVALQPQHALYFIEADHLNTPRLVADANQATVWKWDQQEPFGDNVADENPSGLGVFDLPLRFAGQRYDTETGLHYNYYRDFDPSIGGYKESDLIGLRGGLNTYLYAGGNALSFTDPRGESLAYAGLAVVGLVAIGITSGVIKPPAIPGKTPGSSANSIPGFPAPTAPSPQLIRFVPSGSGGGSVGTNVPCELDGELPLAPADDPARPGPITWSLCMYKCCDGTRISRIVATPSTGCPRFMSPRPGGDPSSIPAR